MSLLRPVIRWLEDRTGLGKALAPLAKHPVPPETTSGKLSWAYVFGAATLFVFIMQVVTGTLLATIYVPSAAHAYDSLRFLTEESTSGRLLRGMHFYGASAMVVLVGLHTARVFLTASYKFPREMSWLSGAVLLLLTMAMAFTGQLLRWTQDGVWSVVVAAYFVGRVPLIGDWLGQFVLAGDMVGGPTLSRFFSFHVFLIPAGIFLLIGLHLYLVFRNGISEMPRAGEPVEPGTYRAWYHAMLERKGRPYWPDAAWKEVLFSVVVLIVVVLLAWFVGARELGSPPDPTVLAADPQPDWFFLWYYALLAVKPPGTEDIVMVYLPLLIGALLLALPFIANRGERSPSRRPWAIALVGGAAIFFGMLTYQGVDAPWVPKLDTAPIRAEAIGIEDEAAQRGAMLFYERGCQYCHAVAGQGGRWGPDLTRVATRMSPEQIVVWTMSGRGDMPSYRDTLTQQEMSDIVAFLQAVDREARSR